MMDRKERILAFMKEDAYKPLLFSELAMVLDVPKSDMGMFGDILDQLEIEGKIFKTHRNRYGVPERMNLIAGHLQGNERGYGFVIPDDENVKDIFISSENLNGAMHKDKVIARVNKKIIGDKRAEGEIIRIVKRANSVVVGTFDRSKHFGFVIPDDTRLSGDVFIPKDQVNGAKAGQKVVAQIMAWPEKRRNAEGKIIEVIGDMDEPGTDILSIIKAYGLQEDFPEEVAKQASMIGQTVSEEMVQGRRDLRKLRMFTIDGEDAKDLDDAISIQKISNDKFRLGVHIADVSHYVKEDTHLDEEALKRGTSVYLVDRVIPMLPKEISNGICSLNPGVDRLAFTVMMEINSCGKVLEYDIFESIINSDERMTYTDVYKMLELDDGEVIECYTHLFEDLKIMKELALILRRRRMDRGAIDFNFDEAKIVLDESGTPTHIEKYENTIANKIIEEFMLACNETVAEHFFWNNSPFIYRIHEEPETEKIEAFSTFAHNMGYTLKGINKIHPRALQELLGKVKGTKEETIISMVMLRSLQKARYSHLNNGHFGLAAKYYCHFTAPIRRYPDLIIHRIMKERLKGISNPTREEKINSRIPGIARHCSERERTADEAERDTQDLKKVEFMKKYEGEEFEGIISNVTSFGMFVGLENTIEGFVRISSMEDDYYIFNDKSYSLVGERNRRIFRIGDIVKVKLIKADVATRKIEFLLVKDKNAEKNEVNEQGNKSNIKKGKRKRKRNIDESVILHIRGKKKKRTKR